MNKRTKRILSSLLVVSVVATAAGFGTRAFFTDTETSTGNVLQAGAIDLKVGNTSYYYDGVVKLADQLSWSVRDLTIERFFDLPTLGDLKPGDWGEDTVELTVTSNPAWVCADIQITENGENVLTDPEAGSEDVTEGVGELGKYLNFVFWADDGDNVWECLPSGYEGTVPSNMVMVNALSRYCERPLLNGTPSNLGTEKVTYAIADSSKDGVWATPLAPETPYFIGKYWCFGNVTPNPVDWSDDPERSPLQGASGFDCTVPYLGWANDAQTDSITADISFTAVQSRHNEEFRCNPVKVVVNEGAPNWTRGVTYRVKGYNTGAELFIGPMTSSSATPRKEKEYNTFQTVGVNTYGLTFSYDPVSSKVLGTIADPAQSLEFDFADGVPGCSEADWDTMEIILRDSRTDSGLALENVQLAANTLGNFGVVQKAGTPGFQHWHVTGFDFTQAFTVTADLLVDGYNGNENIKAEFSLGCMN